MTIPPWEFDRLKDIVLEELHRLTDYLPPQQAKATARTIMRRVTDGGGLLDEDRIGRLQARIAELEAGQ